MSMNTKANQYFWTAIFALSALTAKATPPQWQIDPAKSQLTFTATQNDAPVHGKFNTFTGQIFVDPKDYQHSMIDIMVDIDSISTSYAQLKETLLTSDWFDAKVFPKAEFKATQFQKTGPNTYVANGTLSIREKSAPVSLTFTTQQPDSKTGIVTGNTVIKRTTFGVGQGEWSNTNEIKDDVTINFTVVATRQ